MVLVAFGVDWKLTRLIMLFPLPSKGVGDLLGAHDFAFDQDLTEEAAFTLLAFFLVLLAQAGIDGLGRNLVVVHQDLTNEKVGVLRHGGRWCEVRGTLRAYVVGAWGL